MDQEGTIKIHVRAVAAWMPGIDDAELWRRWSINETLDGKVRPPDVSRIPPLYRRRLNPQGRMAASTVCAVSNSSVDAFVFSSRHGEVARSTALIDGLLRGEPFSPTSFGLSVHNGIAGMLSIASGDNSPCVAISAADQSFVAALLEAVALLADGHQCVVATCYDEPVPGVYAGDVSEPEQPFSVSLRIAKSGGEALSIGRADGAAKDSFTDTHRPQAISFLRFWWAEQACCWLHSSPYPWKLAREQVST